MNHQEQAIIGMILPPHPSQDGDEPQIVEDSFSDTAPYAHTSPGLPFAPSVMGLLGYMDLTASLL